ncbi:hypothetical protein Leryth_009314 [Lithospermum erythrorhizon]|nr:hypothetical protein Leryth_009314 [Lithospermum erythrorhizon]
MHQLTQLHAQMITTSRIHDNFAASRLLSSSTFSGNLNYASKIFQTIQKPNSFMYNTLIRAHACSFNPKKSLGLLMDMLICFVMPGKHTFTFVLKACASLRVVWNCMQVHTHVVKFGLGFDLHVVNGLVRAYSVSGCLVDARKVFDECSVRSLSIWTSMICGYAQNGDSCEAIWLFDEMVGGGVEASGVTLASVLSACANSGCVDLGEEIRLYMEEKGIELNVILGTALVHMYARYGAIAEAKTCFDGMREKNVATWNAMICGLAIHGHAKEALEFFENLKDEQVKPNEITLVGVLSACCHAGLYDYGYKIFYSMRKIYGVEPTIEHYGCMVDLLGRSGRVKEAEKLIRSMEMKADVVIWGALLSACTRHGDYEIAERAAKEILKLDPQNHGVFVVLSNMYAEADRWKDVLKLRKVMKMGNLLKTPGWSYIENAT